MFKYFYNLFIFTGLSCSTNILPNIKKHDLMDQRAFNSIIDLESKDSRSPIVFFY